MELIQLERKSDRYARNESVRQYEMSVRKALHSCTIESPSLFCFLFFLGKEKATHTTSTTSHLTYLERSRSPLHSSFFYTRAAAAAKEIKVRNRAMNGRRHRDMLASRLEIYD